MSLRPTSVTLLCVFGFIIAGYSLVAVLAGWAMYAVHIAHDPMNEALRHDPMYLFNIFALGSVKILLDLYLILACIAAWQLKPAGRSRLLTFAWAELAFALFQFMFNLFFIVPKTLDLFNHSMARSPALATPVMHQFFVLIMYGSAVFTLLLAATYPICLQTFLNRQNVRDAFQGLFPPNQSFEVDIPQPNWP